MRTQNFVDSSLWRVYLATTVIFFSYELSTCLLSFSPITQMKPLLTVSGQRVLRQLTRVFNFTGYLMTVSTVHWVLAKLGQYPFGGHNVAESPVTVAMCWSHSDWKHVRSVRLLLYSDHIHQHNLTPHYANPCTLNVYLLIHPGAVVVLAKPLINCTVEMNRCEASYCPRACAGYYFIGAASSLLSNYRPCRALICLSLVHIIIKSAVILSHTYLGVVVGGRTRAGAINSQYNYRGSCAQNIIVTKRESPVHDVST